MSAVNSHANNLRFKGVFNVAFGLALLLITGPAVAQQAAVSSPVEPREAWPDALRAARDAASSASLSGQSAAALEAQHLRVDDARELLLEEDLDAAEHLLISLRANEALRPAVAARVQVMLGRVSLSRAMGVQALKRFDQVDESSVAAPLHLTWLKAQAAVMAGRFNRAAELYQRVVDEERDSRILHFARAGLADALYQAGHLDAAAQAYDTLLNTYPRYPQRHIATYRRAQIHLLQGRHAEGARMLHEVWWTWPWKEEGVKARLLLESDALAGARPARRPLDDLFERARELRRMKHWEVAEQEFVELLTLALSENASTSFLNRVRMELALVAYDRQEYGSALPQLQALDARLGTPDGVGLDRDFVLRTLQRAYHRSGDSERAEATLRRRYARPGSAQSRALADFYWKDGRYKEARKHLDRVLRVQDREGWDYAFMLYKAEDFVGADRQLNAMLSDRDKRGKIPYEQVVYWLARTHQRRGFKGNARTLFTTLVEKYPWSYYGHQARSRLVDMDRAEAQAPRVEANQPPQDERGVGDDQVASRLLGERPALSMVTEASASHAPTLQARAAASGQAPGTIRPGAPEVGPAINPVDVPAAPESPVQVREPARVPQGDALERQARVYWRGPDAPPEPDNQALYGRDDIADYTTSLRLQGALRQAAARHGDLWPTLHTVSWLYDVGLVWEAQWEMRLVTQEFRGLEYFSRRGARPTATRPIALPRYKRWGHYVDRRRSGPKGFWGLEGDQPLYPVPRDADEKRTMAERQSVIIARMSVLMDDMRRAMMEGGDHHFVRLMRLGRGRWSRTDPGGEFKDEWTEFHPRAFSRYVTRYAEREGLNPYLLWAIMTVESGYNPDTVSHADARGLLQVIPKTGNKVAAAMGENHFGHYDLMDPDTSLRHGAWYFAQLVNKFQGQEPLAIAGYNGGPHNVQRWLLHKHDQPLDEFVEEIPFNEARRYTKRVLRYLAVFLRIYEGHEGIYLGSDLNGDYRAHPRY